MTVSRLEEQTLEGKSCPEQRPHKQHIMLRMRVSTRRRLGLEFLEARLCLSTIPVYTGTTVPDTATQAHLTATSGQLPLSFEINKGQTDPRVNFLTQGAGYTYSLDFPTKNAYQPQRTPQTKPHDGISDAFVTKITFNSP